MEGHAIEANSLKELLRRAILQCEKLRPGFIESLSRHQTPKGRRIVARSAAALYPLSPQLTEYGEQLVADWWYDGNVSRNQVSAYFKRFASLATLSSIPTINKRSERSTLTLEDLNLA